MTSSNWFMLDFKLKLAVTSSNWLLLVVETMLWLVQTGCYWLLKYAVTSSNWLLKLFVETRSNQLLLSVHDKRRWLWLVQTVSCWLLKLAVTRFKLVLADCWRLSLTSSNWFVDCWNWLKQVQTSSYWLCMTREDGCDLFKLVLTDFVETGCD